MRENESAPPDWGNDQLTQFLNSGRNNQWATFFNKRRPTATIISIDAQFDHASRDWVNPRSIIPTILFLRCHSAFRAAAGLVMSGQLVESYVLCRSMLEYAAYAVHIHRDPKRALIWLDRHESKAAMRKQKNEFLLKNVWASVRAANRHAGERAETLYQFMLDFGGHPNERAVTSNLKMADRQGTRTILTTVQHGDGIEVDLALKRLAQCGMVSLEMLQTVFNARFEILGINAEMLKLRKGL